MKNVARVGRKFELHQQVQADSSQLKPSRWPNATQLHRSWELGSSWLESGGAFGAAIEQRGAENKMSHGFDAARHVNKYRIFLSYGKSPNCKTSADWLAQNKINSANSNLRKLT